MKGIVAESGHGRSLGLLLTGLLLAGCGATPAPSTSTETAGSVGTTPDRSTPSGTDEQIVAVPPDGAAPGTAMDIGGPGLEQRCFDGDLPTPVDMADPTISCETVPEDVAAARRTGPVFSGVTFSPGTYWVVMVCGGTGSYAFGADVPGLSAEVEVTCDEEGRAVRHELGIVTEETVGNVMGGPTAAGVYAFWLVREGKTEL